MKYLNLGCGNRFLNDWVNVDFVSNSKYVIPHNLLNGIPFPDSEFDVIYHSHVLEHFSKNDGYEFIKECYRVLKTGGIIRIAVPDLEVIAQQYLNHLEKVQINPSPYNHANYEWSILELIDQTVRNTSGGEMGKYWSQQNLINEEWLMNRMGGEFQDFRTTIKREKINDLSKSSPVQWRRFFQLSTFRKRLLIWLSGEPRLFELLNLARFRTGGEVHQWMYDSYSLGILLKLTGFYEIKIVNAFNSRILDWPSHQWLDVEDGKVRKPDSLFIEAIK